MILTKSEFRAEFGFKCLSSVSHLLKNKSIVANSDGMIDTEAKENKAWIKKRRAEVKKTKKEKSKNKQDNKKNSDQLSLDMDIQNQRLEEKRLRATLLKLKVDKEQGALIETSVLNQVIKAVFDDMIKCLTELPNIYSNEIIDIVRAEENPKEILIEYLTQKITANIKIGLENAKKAAKKYYKDNGDL